MEKSDVQELHRKLMAIQKEIDRLKREESHVERERLLKMIDAELLDAIHNIENLLKEL